MSALVTRLHRLQELGGPAALGNRGWQTSPLTVMLWCPVSYLSPGHGAHRHPSHVRSACVCLMALGPGAAPPREQLPAEPSLPHLSRWVTRASHGVPARVFFCQKPPLCRRVQDALEKVLSVGAQSRKREGDIRKGSGAGRMALNKGGGQSTVQAGGRLEASASRCALVCPTSSGAQRR